MNLFKELSMLFAEIEVLSKELGSEVEWDRTEMTNFDVAINPSMLGTLIGIRLNNGDGFWLPITRGLFDLLKQTKE